MRSFPRQARLRIGLLAGALALTVTALWPATTLAAEPVADSMHKLAVDVRELLPLIYQYDEPGTVVDIDQVDARIATMLSHVHELGSSVAPKTDTYQISYDTLVSQLELARKALASGNDSYGMNLLRSATSVCATCHTQDERTATWLTPADDVLSDPFIAGEFLFMTRQYDQAFEAYQSWLREQQSLSYEPRTLAAFGRLLLTALQMRKSADTIISLLEDFTVRENLEGLLRKDLTEWLAGIRELQGRVDITSQPDPDSVAALAAQWLTDEEPETGGHLILAERQRPRIVWLRSHLYRSLMNETDPARTPHWLYWLALSDRVLEYRFYYSLADMYLKQCMLEYTDNPIARQCYREYENYIAFFYSGSSGTHIPEELEAELTTLEAKVFGPAPGSNMDR